MKTRIVQIVYSRTSYFRFAVMHKNFGTAKLAFWVRCVCPTVFGLVVSKTNANVKLEKKEFEFACVPTFPNVVHPEFRAFIPNKTSKYKFAAFSSSVSQRARHGILMQHIFTMAVQKQMHFPVLFFSLSCNARLTTS